MKSYKITYFYTNNRLISSSLIFICICFIYLGACKEENKLKIETGYTVRGNIKGASDGSVLLLKIENNHVVIVDSGYIQNKKFLLTGNSFKKPELVYLEFERDNVIIDFFIENSDISITADFNIPNSVKVIGSESHDEYANFLHNSSVYANKLQDIHRQNEAAKENNDTSLITELDSTSISVYKEQTNYFNQFALQNPESQVALFITVKHLADMIGPEELFKLYLNFSDSLENSVYFEELQKIIDAQKSLESGKKLPSFCAFDISGKEFCTTNFSEKYILYVFRISFSNETTEVSSKFLSAYKTFNKLPFEIVNIWFDSDYEIAKKAIELNQYPGLNLIAKDGLDSKLINTFDIRKFPKNILANKSGIIIKINISPAELTGFLKEPE